jgi:hypothetical protein
MVFVIRALPVLSSHCVFSMFFSSLISFQFLKISILFLACCPLFFLILICSSDFFFVCVVVLGFEHRSSTCYTFALPLEPLHQPSGSILNFTSSAEPLLAIPLPGLSPYFHLELFLILDTQHA